MGEEVGPTVHQFQNILLGGRGGSNPGQLKVHPEGFLWRKTGGGKMVEVAKADVDSLSWTKLPHAYQLAIRLKAGTKVKFNGFREQDVSNLTTFMASTLGMTAGRKEFATSGRNWGQAELDGKMLGFIVGGKQAFELSIADVCNTQLQGKNDVMLEFHVDDTAGANEKDTLMEMSFHIPNTNTTYIGDDEKPSAQVFQEMILAHADVGPSGDESVVEFEGIHVLTPRGRFKLELHVSFLRLQGLAVDFKIQYSSVVRLFVLPKANQPHTFVVITLDPPIRKGQTFYPHLVLQFATEQEKECSLAMSEELLNAKYKDKLQASYKGLAHEVLAQILRGLSGAKITRQGTFRSHSDGCAVRTSLKAEEGYLYPLEKCFFFLPKPPTLITHEEIDNVEFERHGAGTSSMSSSYFDLVIRLRSDQEYQFRNIQRTEYHNLFHFFDNKRMKILNLGGVEAQAGGGSLAHAEEMLQSDDEAVDHHLHRIKAAGGAAADMSDEEDEDFVAGKDDGGSPTESSEGEDGEDGGSASNDEEHASKEDNGDKDEERQRRKEEKEKEREKKKKEKASASLSTSASKKRKDEDEDGGGGKKKRRKKDPNAPKRALSGFMYFSVEERERLKKESPNMSFVDVGKATGERWKTLSAEEKRPYEEKAKVDKARYVEEMSSYKSGGAGAGAGAGAGTGAGGVGEGGAGADGDVDESGPE
eukprot:TRINITY_DN5150_c0_g1_i6.p1 TRINITY_DN5150_c0_g1~~TRINITY_DN5150_c0_g1_i6.p1  ORF type:complete len:701 (+),score=261.43 TRINITY_DN5150_c0_g1_i6:184-2286(+)